MSSIAAAAANAGAYLRDHPDEARYRDSPARARLSGGLRVDVTGPGGEELHTDMPRAIGGSAIVPSPGWYYRAAAAACVASLIGIRAAMLDIELPADAVEVTVDSESDDRGILGIADSIPAGVLSLRVAVALAGGSMERDAFEALVRWAVEHCPVTDTTRREIPIEIAIA